MSKSERNRVARHRRQLHRARRLRAQFTTDTPKLDEVVRIRQQRLADVLVDVWGYE